MGTIVLWGIFLMGVISDVKFCKEKAERLDIKIKELKNIRSEPFDFLFDIFLGTIALIIMLIQQENTFSWFLSMLMFFIYFSTLIHDIKRLSKKEAE